MSDSAQEKMAQALQEQHAQWNSFATKALESSIRLFELNLKMTRQSLEDTSLSVRHLLEAKTPEQLFSVDQKLMQEKLNQVLTYANEIGAITSAFTTEISQAAQNQMAGSVEKVTRYADGAAGSGAQQSMFPDLSQAQHGYEQWLDAGKKIVEAFGQNLAMPGNLVEPVKKAAAKPATTRARAR